MSTKPRLKPAVRREQILTAALSLAEASHYLRLTRDQIAESLGLSGPAVQYHFGTMKQLRGDLMRAAIKRENLVVLSQGLLSQDKRAQGAPEGLRVRALASVSR